MDLKIVEQIISATLSSVDKERGTAELNLKSLREQNQFFPLLLQLVSKIDTSKDVRIAATIHFKNSLINRWDKLPNEDKEYVRNNILSVVASSEILVIVKLLSVAVRIIGETDFPTIWTSFIPTVISFINSNNMTQVTNILFALRNMIHSFVFRLSEKRPDSTIRELSSVILPVLFQLYSGARTNLIGEIKTPILLIQIEKTFNDLVHCFPVVFLPHLDIFEKWMIEFKTVLDIPFGQTGENIIPLQPDDVVERENFSWWKVKKWIFNIINKIFTTYGKPNQEQKDAFSTLWVNKYAIGFLQSSIAIMMLKKNGRYYHEYVLNLALTFTATASQISVTYKFLKQHLEFFLIDIILGCIRKTDDQLNQFTERPEEYIQEQNDCSADFKSESYAASCLLIDLAKYRGKDVLPPLMVYYSEFLTKYQALPPAEQDYRMKDAVYTCLCNLSDNLLSKTVYRAAIEGLLVNCVFPDFQSPHCLLRSQACTIMDNFSRYEFSRPDYHQFVLDRIVLCMSDTSIPVKINAAIAIGQICEIESYKLYFTDEKIVTILKSYLELSLVFSLDTLTAAFSSFLDAFDKPIRPHILEISQTLLTSFLKLANSGDDEKLTNSLGYCDLLTSMCYKCENDPVLLNLLEALLVPNLVGFLACEKFYLELFESVVDIVGFFTYRIDNFTPELWAAFPLLIADLDDIAPDYLGACASALENYISRSTSQFLSGEMMFHGERVTYLDGLCQLLFRLLLRADEEADSCYCCLLLLAVLLNCPSVHKVVIPHFVENAIQRILQPLKKECFKVLLFEIIEVSLGYEPLLTLKLLADKNLLTQIILEILKSADSHKEAEEKAIFIFGFTGLIKLPFESWPSTLVTHSKEIICIVVNQLENMRNQIQEEANDNPNSVGDDQDDDFQYPKDDWGYEEDHDAVDPTEVQYSSILTQLDNGKEYEEFQSFCGYNSNEACGYLEPIRSIQLCELFTNNYESNSGLVAAITSNMNPEEQRILRDCLNLGRQNQ